MRTRPGGYYRLALALSAAEHVGPSWLAAAVTGTYPKADLYEVEQYDSVAAVVIVRFRAEGEVAPGDTLSATVEGVQLPGGVTPTAEVQAVEEMQLVAHPSDVAAEAVESLPTEYSAAIKLTLAGALLLSVVYFSNRIASSQEARGV